jgi:arylsulfatase
MLSRMRWRTPRLRAALASAVALLACGGPEPPRLLLLVTVDTLRADRLGAYGSPLGLTPHLDALAAAGLVFTSAYAASSFTLPSLSALLTGRYPEEYGMWSNESAVPADVPTLASLLRARGWRTAAVVSNFVLRRSSGLAEGFAHFDDEFPDWEPTRGWPERVAGSTTRAALPILEECTANPEDRCFLWVHYQDPHGPYVPPADLRERSLAAERAAADGTRSLALREDHMGMGGIPRYQVLEGRREVGFYRAGYDGEIAYADAEIGRLLARVAELGLGDRSVIAFAADHGEGLGENDYWFAHGEYLSEELVRVPLLLRAPGLAPGRRDEVVALVDVLPTLLALVGAGGATGAPSGGGEGGAGAAAAAAPPGRDLLAPGASQAASVPYLATLGGSTVVRHGVVEGDYKLVLSERDGVWDARLVRRGREQVDLAPAAPQIAAQLRERLAELRARHATGREELRQEFSPEERERLRSLGYLE